MQELTWDQICRRASGRRHYNAVRQVRREYRRYQLAALLGTVGAGRGGQARLAAYFGVSEATISRDIAALNAAWRRRYFA